MALKAIHVSDVPNLDQVPENASVAFYSSRFSTGMEVGRSSFKAPKFLVVGHRGNGMNKLQLSDRRMKAVKENTVLSFNTAARFAVDFIEFDVQVIGHRGSGMNKLQSSDRRMKAVKENTILSFNTATQFAVDFIEFDVQVTKDGCPIIFHDNFIMSEENGTIFEKRVTELNLCEFLAYGPQNESDKVGKPLMRRTKDGKIISWGVETDDRLCTLQEAFERTEPKLGFNIELKFDDHIVYEQDYLISILQSILQVVAEYAKDRPIIFSTFQPDAALLVRKLQGAYPVFFLTNGGNEIYYDVRRNTLEEAVKLCLEGGLQGIVSEVKGIFRDPGAVSKIKESKLALLTYGQLNNVPEAVYIQHLMGIDGVIVDLVEEITRAVNNLIKPATSSEGKQLQSDSKPQFSERELSFLLKLIPELIQQ